MTCHQGRVRILFATCLLAALSVSPFALGQDLSLIDYDGPNGGFWDVNMHWEDDVIGEPLADFAEQAVINTGVTVNVNTLQNTPITDTGGVLLGVTGNTGGLTVQNGGNLNIRISDLHNGRITPGYLEVGRASRGFVTVEGGGTLAAEQILQGGPAGTPTAPESKITVGNASASPAVLTSQGLTSLRRTTQITGPNANFTSKGMLTLANSHTLIADITAATHSAIKATPSTGPGTGGTGNAYVDGTLKVQFSTVVPALGNSWNLIDAQTIHGNFSSVDSTHASAALTGGKGYGTRIVNGGTNGKLLQVVVEQFLTLQIDPATDQMKIRNPAAAGAGLNDVGITGYQIQSKYGSLSTGSWSSLTDQGNAGWQEGTPNANFVGEIKSTAGTTGVPGGNVALSTRNLGAIYQQAFPAFGTPVTDDLSFTYTTSDGVRRGLIEFQGDVAVNNMRLHVNPATGAAQLRNDSPHTIEIEGYSIFSPTNQLTPGTWNSLDDQNVSPNVVEAAPTAGVLSELVFDDTITLGAFQTYSLGTIHPIAGTQNLTFEFLLEGAGDAQNGTVTYGPPLPEPTPTDADFDNDGDVDGSDFLTWQRGVGVGTTNATGDANNSGTVDGADLTIWRSEFGPAGVAAVGAVPEPSTAVLAMLAGGLFWRRSRRQEKKTLDASNANENLLQRSNAMSRSQSRSGFVAAVAGLLAVAALAATVRSTQAADILLVSRPAQFGAPDDQLITLLKSFGHNIVNERDVPLNQAAFTDAPPTAAELAGVDMILISRNANSGDYTNNAAETLGWNSITLPILMMNPQLARGGHATLGNNRFGLVNMEATTTVDNWGATLPAQVLPTDYDPFPLPANPFVAGRTQDVFFLYESMDYLNRDSTKFPPTAVTVANMTINGAQVAGIVDIPATATLFTNAQGVVDPLAGRRVLMQMVEYPDTHDVFRLTLNGGQIVNQIINSLTLTAASMPPGDVDGNGVANIADFNLIRANLGTSVTNRNQGDLNGDSFVDVFDYRLWKAVAAPADVAAAVIPEPAGLAMALVGAISVFAARRRGKA